MFIITFLHMQGSTRGSLQWQFEHDNPYTPYSTRVNFTWLYVSNSISYRVKISGNSDHRYAWLRLISTQVYLASLKHRAKTWLEMEKFNNLGVHICVNVWNKHSKMHICIATKYFCNILVYVHLCTYTMNYT